MVASTPINSGNFEAAIKSFKIKVQREGIYRKLRQIQYHESTAERAARKLQESFRRKKRKPR